MSEPYLPLYVGDYLRDTGYLTLEQHGAYCMLLMRLWSAGGALPSDEGKLSRIAGVTVKKWRPIWADLASYFEIEDGQITHKRITSELEKAGVLRAKRAAAGAKGGAAKSMKTNDAPVANAKARPKQIIPDQVVVKEEPNGSLKKPMRLPADFAFPEEWRQWAIDAGLPADRCQLEFTKLTNWAANAPNSKGAKSNWFKAWQNWVLGAIDNLPKARGSPGYSKPEKPDHFDNQVRELIHGQDRSSRSDSSHWDDAQGVPVFAIEYERR